MDLIQPRHSYAPETGQGHIYTNTSLWTMGALLQNEGVDISLHDENIRLIEKLDSNIVGINLLGAPYIPVVLETIEHLRAKFGNDLLVVLGGQVLTQKKTKSGETLGLNDDQFQAIFGDKVYNGMKPGVLEGLLNIKNISDGHNISLISMYDKLSDEDFKLYFTREISLYVSQGCKFDCAFCAAVKNQKEQYRDEQIIYHDLCYIVERLEKLGEHHVDIYMSNLDVFQSPQALNGFADMILQIKQMHPDFMFNLRGLAGVKSFIQLDQQHPEILSKLVEAGFSSAGYGVDGMGPDIWKGIKKPQNNEKDVLDTIRLSREKYNITPELLMVFGHNGVDTTQTLQDAYEFVEAMVNKYGAIPRPHVAKAFIPGNDGRSNPAFKEQIEQLIRDPKLFQSLDFTALAGNVTHLDPEFRALVNHYYLKMCALPGNTTLPIIPYEIGDSKEILAAKKEENIGKFDR